MDSMQKRNIFLAVIVFLVAVFIITAAITLAQGPRESSVEVISQTGGGELVINDLYDGKMTIPNFDIPRSNYKPDSFVERKGVIGYEDGDSYLGINVNSQMGEIDWAKVAESGVDYAMIRVGFRQDKRGKIVLDENFTANMTGAKDAGLPVGVYFFSKAVSNAEAEEEAAFVLEQIKGYSVKYPIAIYWRYDVNDDGSLRQDSRTVGCNGEQVTGFIGAFCKKVKNAGFSASYYCDKSMGYEKLDLTQLRDYDMWYAEHRPAPSFIYDFKMWQYTAKGEVPGISKEVPITIALKKYQ